MHEAAPLTIKTKEKYKVVVSHVMDWIKMHVRKKDEFIHHLSFWTAMRYNHDMGRVWTFRNETGYSKWWPRGRTMGDGWKSSSIALIVELPNPTQKIKAAMQIDSDDSLMFPICEIRKRNESSLLNKKDKTRSTSRMKIICEAQFLYLPVLGNSSLHIVGVILIICLFHCRFNCEKRLRSRWNQIFVLLVMEEMRMTVCDAFSNTLNNFIPDKHLLSTFRIFNA